MMLASRRTHMLVAAVVFFCVPGAASVCLAIPDWVISSGRHPTGSELIGPAAITFSLMTLAALWSMSRRPWFSLLIIPLVFLALTWHPMGTFVSDLWQGRASNLVANVEVILTVDLL